MVNKRVERYSRGIILEGVLFKELGFYYAGMVNGNDLDNLVTILKKLRDSTNNKPVIQQIKTTKGVGCPLEERASNFMQGVAKLGLGTESQIKGNFSTPSLTFIFANVLIDTPAED